MANKIVQLQDKDGDNVFPIAGGMAADSITTTMLQDDAVTGDKIAAETITSHNIDFATISSDPVLIGQYIENGVTYNRYLKRVRVTGLKDIATGSYKSVPNVIPAGTVYAVATASLQRSLGGSSKIYEIVPNYAPNGTTNALIDISGTLRVYNYGGISTTDVSVDCLVDIEYGIIAS